MSLRLTILVFFLALYSRSQVNSLWTAQKKISYNNYGYCVSTGPEGNVYVSGAFSGAYRDPEVNSMGCFLTAYDASGKEQWHKEFYSLYGAIAASNAVNSKGEVVLAGPGILKFSSAGSLIDSFPSKGLWACSGLAIDSEDNVIVAGSCTPDSMIAGIKIPGQTFLTKYGSEGTQIWARACYIDQGPNQDFDIAVDETGNIYATGGFGGTIDLSSELLLTSEYRYDGFAIKFNPQGKAIWARSFGGEKSEYPRAIAVGKKGDIYISGTYYGIMAAENFSTPVQQGVCDLFLIKYDTDGNLQWLKSGGGEGLESVPELTIDEHENVFFTGRYNTPTTFKWGDLAITKTQDHYTFLYLLQLDRDGNGVSLTSSHIGGAEGRDITCDNKGYLYLTGGFGGHLDFAGKTLDGEGMFLIKLSYDMNNKVGIQEETTEADLFHIFPNPGKEIFNISFSEDLCPDASIQVYETSGRCILSKRSIGCDERNFQCTAPPGVYLVELRSGSKRQTRKVIIQ